MMTRHYDDEKIIAFLDSHEAAAGDPHISKCGRCAATLDEYRGLQGTLNSEVVWAMPLRNGGPVASTLAVLQLSSNRMAREDAEASTFLTELLSGPREWWSNQLRMNAVHRTAGMVRSLIDASDRAIDTMPPDAVELAALAAQVAETLEPADYPSDEVMRLRGTAGRQYAFALFYVGEFSKAKRVVSAARAALEQCGISEYDLARLNIVGSMVARGLDELNEALTLAQASHEVLARSGDRERAASAAMNLSAVLFTLSRSRQALAVLLPVAADLPALQSDTQGRLLASIALNYREAGDLDAAIRYYQLALAALRETSTGTTEMLRIEWHLGSLLLLVGKRAEAERRLLQVVPKFELLSMGSEAAMASLDLAEICLTDGRYQEVESICRRAMNYYERVGASYGGAAGTALAYLHEAAKERRATPVVVEHVRSYLRRLPAQPALLFAPPPP